MTSQQSIGRHQTCGICESIVYGQPRYGYGRQLQTYIVCPSCFEAQMRDHISGREALARIVTVTESTRWMERSALVKA